MPLTPATRLGSYEIVAPLGAGGMGEVYRAKDLRLGREVALKVLPSEVSSNADRLARFEREARTVAALNHPNIVVLHSMEEENGIHFLTMELVDGQSLDQHVVPGGLPVARVVELGIALSDALVAAHEKGVVHRDLKPANVMLTREGRVKVLDFGLAKPAGAASRLEATHAATRTAPLSSAGQVLGTVPYMSPEQIRGEAMDARSDLFSLGILLYELAAGRRPFNGATFADVSSSILRDMPETLTKVRADLPSDLGRIVGRCLEKNPRERFQTALDVCNELRRTKQAIEIGIPATPPSQTVASIAVLPFVNMSHDQENEYFSDGLAEELMNMLAKIRGLRVAARTSSFHFKGKNPTIAEVGATLNVATVLEGSVRKSGSRVRISVQLVKVSDGYHLWSETFERTLDDIFAVQDEVARAVVAALPGELLINQSGLATSRGTRHSDAYDAYLEGRFLWNKRTESDVRKAIQFFEQAIALDPEFAEAWAGLADSYVVLPYYSLVPTTETLPKAREAARRALELKPELGPAHATLAYALMVDLQWPEADSEFRRAIMLSPEDATAHKWYADLLMMTGRSSAALRELRRALELDPLSANIWTIMGEWHWLEGQLDEAMARYRKALELTPTQPLALELAARLCWQRDDVEQYFALRERLEAVSQRIAVPTAALREAYARGGRSEVLRVQLSAPVARLLPSDRARWHAELGDLDAAFQDLDDSLAQRELRLAYTTYFADFAPLWKDPRYDALLVRMGVRMPR
jgi:eukaryotic-like serine/threonine-protein kinase